MTWTAKENRVIWNNDLRGDYIKEWIDRGYPDYGKTGWESLDIHHILPREWGGTNDFWNLGSG
jgi:filamentous hemagglutinin